MKVFGVYLFQGFVRLPGKVFLTFCINILMYLLILYSSFISFLISILYGKFIGIRGTAILTIFLLLISNVCSIFLFYEVCCLRSTCYLDLLAWLNIDYLFIQYNLIFDPLTTIMLLVINIISLFAHIYSIDYMGSDAHFNRFMAYLSLFTFCMLILVTANNLLQLFIGWEGVGICSYLLINFWFIRIQANKAALKALFINKLSDLSLLLGIALINVLVASVDFSVIFSPLIYLYNSTVVFLDIPLNTLYLICLLLLFGAMGKSAQIGLHVWLPDAMEGPTPVSSLIHAATMVTAGVFLVVRTSFMFEYIGNISLLIILVSCLTILFSSTVGLFQNDIKKVIAYSTCSQIGYMFFVCGYAGYSSSMFHLFNHAFFKALLFLAAGAIIHAISSEQDIRKMGGLYRLLPFSYVSFFVGSISLTGFPFLTGFYSKDFLMELPYLFSIEFLLEFTNFVFIIKACYWLSLISVVLTSLYSIRLLSFVFFSYFNGFPSFIRFIYDMPIYMNLVIFLLSIFSIFIGFYVYDMMVGLGSDFWQNSLFTYNAFDYEFNSIYIKILPIIYSLYGIIICLLLYNSKYMYLFMYVSQVFQLFYKKLYFFNKRWYFDKIYNEYIVNPILVNFAYYITLQLLDKGAIEFFGPSIITKFILKNLLFVSRIQTGLVYHYAGIMLNFILFLFAIPMFSLFSYDIFLVF